MKEIKVRVSDEVYIKIKGLSEADDRSVNSWINSVLQRLAPIVAKEREEARKHIVDTEAIKESHSHRVKSDMEERIEAEKVDSIDPIKKFCSKCSGVREYKDGKCTICKT